ncbi:MAG: Mur ligase family protein, partial [Nitrospinaceae bacterium]
MMQIHDGIQTIIFSAGETDKVDQGRSNKLSRLLKGYPLLNLLGTLDREVSSIAFDSRKVERGSLFVAIPGLKHDGSQFIREAIGRGASAFITEVPLDLLNGVGLSSKNITAIQVQDCRAALSWVSAEYYNQPTRRMNLVGITGTNGKTTLTYALEHIYRMRKEKTGVIGSIRYRFGDRDIPAPITTPESLELNRMFDEMLEKEIKTCFLEVSSHSLALKRVHGMHFAIGVFINLSRDHLDFHGSMENYKNAKKDLFRHNSVDK